MFRKLIVLLQSHVDLHRRLDKLELRVTELENAKAFGEAREANIRQLIEERLALYDKHRDAKARERMGLLDGTQADVERLRLENARGLAEDQGIDAEIRDVGGEDRLIVGHPVDVAAVSSNRVSNIEHFDNRASIVDQVDAMMAKRARRGHSLFANVQGA